MTPGDMMANTPLDFLLEGSDCELVLCYLDGPPPPFAELPDHDLAFLAVGQSDESTPLLAALRGALDAWPRPVANNRPEVIAALTRDRVAAHFSGHPDVCCPPTLRTSRAALTAMILDGPAAAGMAYPLIVRPIGSHAGKGLERVDGPGQLGAYLALHPVQEFYVAPFVDYAGPDGLYRKLRLVFVRGRPFLAHMAVSAHWLGAASNAYITVDKHGAMRAAGGICVTPHDLARFAEMMRRRGIAGDRQVVRAGGSTTSTRRAIRKHGRRRNSPRCFRMPATEASGTGSTARRMC